MKKRSIAKQLFIATFIVMVIMMGAILLVQNLFFDMFYKSWKINNLNNNMAQFSQDYEANDWSYSDYFSAKQNFFESNNAQINLLDQKGESIEASLWLAQPWYNVTCTTENKEEYYFQINEFDIITQLGKNNFKIGESYIVFGNVMQNNYIELFLIYSDNNDSFFAAAPKDKSDINFLSENIIVSMIQQATSNEIESKVYPFSFESLPSHSNILGNSYIGPGSMIVSDSSSIENIFMSEQISGQGRSVESYTVTVSASIQPIDEAATALTSYFPIFFVFVLMAALVLAFLYSKMVVKPLLKINHVAGQMANLDFVGRLDTTANNEFGSLSQSLNMLAGNLDSSLQHLQQANQKLTQDIIQKEKQENARKEFVANVSHELKTPLGVMSCYVESLQDNILPEKTLEYYEVLKNEINKMNIMILQMLELAKAEAGSISLDIVKVNMKDMLDDILALYSFQAQERKLIFDIQGEFANVLADYMRIEQVCTNLIVNAIHHALINSRVKIVGKIEDGKNKISIINKCQPMEQYEAEKLWQRFYKADKSHKARGTGLGLTIVAAILDMHEADYGVIAHENSIEFYFEIKLT